MAKKKQTKTLKPRNFHMNQMLVSKGHQVHKLSQRKIQRSEKRCSDFSVRFAMGQPIAKRITYREEKKWQ
jgi:hypothetical protein